MSSIPSTLETVFHADLSDAYPGELYWVRANNANHPLIPHTAQTRARARAADPRLGSIPDARLTHHTEPLSMPAQGVKRVHIKHSTKHLPHLHAPAAPAAAAIYVPPSAAQLAKEGARQIQLPIDHVTTAKALAFHHPDLLTGNPEIAGVIFDWMDNNEEIAHQFETLGQLIRDMGKPSTDPEQGWATLVAYTPPPCEETGVKGVPTFFLNPRQEYMSAAGAVQTNMMLVTKNDPALRGKTWRVQYGASVLPADAATGELEQEEPTSGGPTTLATLETATTDDDWTVAVTNSQRLDGLQVSVGAINSSTKQFSITFNDNYLRYLGLYIRFFDADGNTIDLSDWTPDGEDSVTSTTYLIREALGELIEYDDLQFIGYTSGATTVAAVPVIDAETTVQITMPAGAVGAEVLGSGLGIGSFDWWKTPLFGGAVTTIMELVVPVFMLAGAAYSYSNAADKAEVQKLLKGKWKKAIAQAIYYILDGLYSTVTDKKIAWSDLIGVAKTLFQPASLELLLYIEAKMLLEEAEEEVPFAGWILIALNISLGIAQLAETIVELTTSPWNIKCGITSTITSAVTVYPDPRHQAFPQAPAGDSASLVVTMTYKGQKRAAVSATQAVPASTPATLTALFPRNTLGGEIKIDATYFIDTWQAAQASTGWMDNDEAHAAAIDLYLVQNPVPLDENSIYQHSAILTYQNSAYQWQPTAQAPTATLADRDSSSSGNAISSWNGLTLSQRYAALGYAWKAAGMGLVSCSSGATGQLYGMQNTGIPGGSMAGTAFPGCGPQQPTRMVYDPNPPKYLMEDGNWVPPDDPTPDPNDTSLGDYWLDPRKADVAQENGGGYCLRQIDLSGSSVAFDMAAEQSCWARFSERPDALAIHPSGHVVAVHGQSGKLSITPLQTAGQPDAEVPLAFAYAGQAMEQDRPGLLFTPLAVSCSSDGTILVLEQTKGSQSSLATIPAVARIQAFDLTGQPVNRFRDGSGEPTPFLPLAGVGEATYLDLCVVGDLKMTYLYVLYYTGAGDAVSDYHMAIYQYGLEAPSSNPLVTTDGVAAANLFVDMWHTVYTLNYAMVTDGAGTPAGPETGSTGPDGRTVPSLSEWLPPIPED